MFVEHLEIVNRGDRCGVSSVAAFVIVEVETDVG